MGSDGKYFQKFNKRGEKAARFAILSTRQTTPRFVSAFITRHNQAIGTVLVQKVSTILCTLHKVKPISGSILCYTLDLYVYDVWMLPRPEWRFQHHDNILMPTLDKVPWMLWRKNMRLDFYFCCWGTYPPCELRGSSVCPRKTRLAMLPL